MEILADKHFQLPACELIEMVEEAREHTLDCVADLDDTQLTVPLMEVVNPFRWELGHVAFFYDVFLLRVIEQRPPVMAQGDALYDSFKVDHDDRWHLPLPTRQETLHYMERVKTLVVGRLDASEPSARETYLHVLSLVHEDMHGEAFTYMRQTLGYARPSFRNAGKSSIANGFGGGPLPGDVEVPGGIFQLGATPSMPFVFDNEKWAHAVEVPAFEIARTPVTNAEFAAFVEDHGYLRQELWSLQGWVWRTKSGARNPVYWSRGESGWWGRDFDTLVPLEEHAPAMHINWYEAEAYCNWAGRRLPTEAEWELAASAEPSASGDRITERKRRHPWGDVAPAAEQANLDARQPGCADVGAFAAGDSAFGCRQMIGNVWEWTASPFYPYSGYVTDFPYREYSAPWFGYRKVLKGGSWATRPRFAYNTYRNFFQPYRNDLFAGFRTCSNRQGAAPH